MDPLVGVDDHAEKTGVGVDEVGVVAAAKIVENGRLIQVRELGHILNTVELDGVAGEDLHSILMFLGSLTINGQDTYAALRVLDGDFHIIEFTLDDLGGNESFLLGVGLEPDKFLVGGQREVGIKSKLEKFLVVREFAKTVRHLKD